MKIFCVKAVVHLILMCAVNEVFFKSLIIFATIGFVPMSIVMPADIIFHIISLIICMSDNIKTWEEVTKEQKETISSETM